MRLRDKIFAGTLTGVVAATVITAAFLPSSPAYAEYVVDFTQGDYSVWDGISYTFDWYETPTEVDGVTTYTIASASDLAGFCVLTNNLSASEFSGITSNVAAEDADYIALVDTFEDAVVKLDCNIDLANFDWMPISYPWATANLSASYDIHTPEGTVVHYNGVDYIPDDTVDPWVGDENGDPISTRYWEYPESELRFRDLMQYNTHASEMIEDAITTHPNSVWEEGPGYFFKLALYDRNVAVSVSNFADDRINLSAYHMLDIDYETDFNINFGLKNIKGYTETDGFLGTFDGKLYNIKGLASKTPWTSDAERRLTTYDPIAKGLFGMLGEAGVIQNLNVQGEYVDEVVSYSALLCAYNYGTIDSCYVDGKMKQSLIEMLYPVNKDYIPNGQSTYVLAEQAGTVMPLGNSGFMTSQNYGTIKNSYTVGTVTQAFRSFGFFAATNYGTIENCENRASLSTEYVETDFITDEWSWSDSVNVRFSKIANTDVSCFWKPYDGSYTLDGYGYAWNTGDYVGTRVSNYEPEHVWTSLPSVTHFDANRYTGVLYDAHTANIDNQAFWNSTSAYNAGTKLTFDDYHCYDWVVGLYNTEDAESIAANHLYGVYVQTTVGGIAAVNYGALSHVINKGNIESLYGTSPRNNFSKYENLDADPTANRERDYYSYIRPYNQYGIFATAGSTSTLAGGITAQNLGELTYAENRGNITNREASVVETAHHDWKLYSDVLLDDMIVYTGNGFYQNGARFQKPGETNWTYSAMTALWWITEDYYQDVICAELNNQITQTWKDASSANEQSVTVTYDCFDRNMPYPYVHDVLCEAYIYNAGIAAQNASTVEHASNSGSADAGITYLSYGKENDAEIDWCTNTGIVTVANMAHNVIDSNISNCETESAYTAAEEQYIAGIANFVEQRERNVSLSSNYVYQGTGAFDTVTAVDRIDMTDIYIYDDSQLGEGIARKMTNVDAADLYNFQESVNGVAEVEKCSINNAYIYGKSGNGIGQGTLIGESSDWRFCGPEANIAIGKFEAVENEAASIDNIQVYMFQDGALGKASNGVGTFKALEINNVDIFCNFIKNALNCYNCTIKQLSLCGSSDIFTESSESDYVYYFENSDCTDMLLQADINLDYQFYNKTLTLQNIPGILKAVADTNQFTNCAISTPDGMLSFPSKNASVTDDNTIQSDASLVYVDNAHACGALAYAMDHGNKANRTYDYTVAVNDRINIFADITDYLESDRVHITSDYVLPAYTRKIRAADEKCFYAVNVPFNGNGAGYLQAFRNNTEYSTTSEDALFPKTALYVQTGDIVSINATVNDGFKLVGLERAALDELTSEEIAENNPVYTMTVDNSDVTLLAQWSDIYNIEVDENDWCRIITNCIGAAYKQSVRIQLQTLTDDFVISRVYYCPYALDENNREVLDLSTEVDIDMNTLEFKMPKSSVRIFAEQSSTANNITEFVLAGQHGVIDNAANTISFTFADSVDLTNASPDVIQVSNGCEVSPAVDIPQDFTKPVVYEVTAPSGDVRRYTVSVTLKKDGEITEFSLLQYKGIITEDGTITVTLPKTVDVTACIPTVVWSGLDITPDITQPQDFTQTVSYTVTASDGTQKTYTVAVVFIETDAPIGVLQIDTVDGTPLQVDIDYALKCITITYPYGTDVSELTIAGIGFDGTTNLIAGDKLNLTKYNCLVVSNGGDTAAFDIIGIEKPLDVKRITQFRIYGHDAVINEETHSIAVTLPAKYDITNIAPDAVGFVGKSITDISVRHDFTQPVIYTVTAADGTTVDYTVTIVKGDN